MGKKMCSMNSLLNIGNARVQGAARHLQRSGPHTHSVIQSVLVAKGRARHYLKESNLEAVLHAAAGTMGTVLAERCRKVRNLLSTAV